MRRFLRWSAGLSVAPLCRSSSSASCLASKVLDIFKHQLHLIPIKPFGLRAELSTTGAASADGEAPDHSCRILIRTALSRCQYLGSRGKPVGAMLRQHRQHHPRA
jgi:hypothetical protein